MRDRLALHGSPASKRVCGRMETVTLAAYGAALTRVDWRLDEPSRLLEQLGGVDFHGGDILGFSVQLFSDTRGRRTAIVATNLKLAPQAVTDALDAAEAAAIRAAS